MKLFRHKKTNGLYRIVRLAKMQCAEPVQDMASLVVYQAADGEYWARPVKEFFDGRFEEMEAPE